MTGSGNVDLVRSIHADWARGDFSEFGWARPEFEWIIADGPRAGSFKGVVGAEESLYEWVRVSAGVQNALTAMAAGRFSVEGDVLLAARLEAMFGAG